MADAPPSLSSPAETAASEANPVQLKAVALMDENEEIGSTNSSSAMGSSQDGKTREFKAVLSGKRKLAMPSSDINKPKFCDENPIESSSEWSTSEISTSKRNQRTKDHKPSYQQQHEHINERMKALHDLIPNSSKDDEISNVG